MASTSSTVVPSSSSTVQGRRPVSAGKSSTTTHESLVGVVNNVFWVSEQDNYVFATIHCDNSENTITVKGPAQRAELQKNHCYRFLGKWEPAKGRHGPSFGFSAFFQEIRLSRSGVVEYLHRMLRDKNTGIGERTAERIYDAYQAKSIKRIMLFPAEIAREFRLDVDKVRAAGKILEADKRDQDTKIALVDLFSGYSFPRDTISECIKLWGPRAPALVRRNPFLLMLNNIKGAGFLRCDKLFLDCGGKPDLLIRQTLAAWYALRSEGSGDTWYPISKPWEMCKKLLAGVTPDPERAIKVGGKKQFFGFYLHAPDGVSDGESTTEKKPISPWSIWVAEHQAAQSEADLARLVRQRVANPPAWPELDVSALTPHQAEQLRAAIKTRVAILTGTPGTGKTFTAAVVVRAILQTANEGDIAVMAPTGKAAVRVAEAMERYDISLPATTIHRGLRPGDLGYGTGNWNFAHNEKSPLPAKWLIVDESSMIDTDLMAAIFRALRPDAHILLVGDPYQLPPVGHGAPLRDLIASGVVSVGELTELHRNSGLIADVCKRIKDGSRFAVASKFDPTTGANLLSMSASDSASAVARIDEIVSAITTKKITHPGGREIDPVEEFQVLVAMNDKGISRKLLNTHLQNRLNRDGARNGENPFRVGDKVICTSNGNYTDAENPKLTHAVMNGEMGRVRELPSAKTVVIYFSPAGGGDDAPPRIVKVPAVGEGCTFQLAYAITAHKSQGSEWPVVAVAVDPGASRVCSREWHYTAISRAKLCCVLVGSLSVLQRQCERVTLRDRKTFLRERLVENVG